jgi:phosphopantothenoylcysteine decarboxylase/phosphopantothenate--cysteine ligase
VISRRESSGTKPSIVVTAGPTREKIDPVRFISNHSTGTFGYAIAREAARRGCRVTLVSGPTALGSPRGIRTIRVESAAEMLKAVRKAVRGARCLIMAAAVSDWRVRRRSAGKLKRGRGRMTLELVENPDIIASLGKYRDKGLALVGFALETSSLERNAADKMRRKGLDMIVANKVGRASAAFGDNNIDILIIGRGGQRTRVRGTDKAGAAKIILDRVFDLTI